MGRMNDAVAEMTAVVKQNPEEDEAWIKRATLYFDMAKYKEAIHDYTQALETSFGSNETIYRARARAYEKLGQKDLAQKDLKKAEELQKKPTVSPI
jgi:tetratricopeptide (TPR) repeat protein